MLTVVPDGCPGREGGKDASPSLVDEIVRLGARRMGAGALRGCARRGMRAPVLAAGDGALGFRDALREVFPGTRQGRCWFRKTASVPGALPGSAHPGANRALAGIWGAGDNDHARAAVTAFGTADRLKFPKAVATITGDLDELPACCGSPAGHWVHLRTASPVKPAFATVAFKLIGAAQDHCRMVSAPHLVTLLKAGARFEHGVLTGRPEPAAA